MREGIGATQQHMAAILDTRPETVCDWERGATPVDTRAWIVLAAIVWDEVGSDIPPVKTVERIARYRSGNHPKLVRVAVTTVGVKSRHAAKALQETTRIQVLRACRAWFARLEEMRRTQVEILDAAASKYENDETLKQSGGWPKGPGKRSPAGLYKIAFDRWRKAFDETYAESCRLLQEDLQAIDDRFVTASGRLFRALDETRDRTMQLDDPESGEPKITAPIVCAAYAAWLAGLEEVRGNPTRWSAALSTVLKRYNRTSQSQSR